MKELKDIIAEKLMQLRKAHNFTQTELGEKLNYSDKAISKWEHGESLPGIEVFCELAKIYNVTLDYLVSETPVEVVVPLKEAKEAQRRRACNQIVITSLAVLIVWFFSTAVCVYSIQWFKVMYWQIFIWSIPISTIICIVFNGIWGKREYVFVLASILVWSLIGSIYCEFIAHNMWPLFLLGVPSQIAIALWANLKKVKKPARNKKIPKNFE